MWRLAAAPLTGPASRTRGNALREEPGRGPVQHAARGPPACAHPATAPAQTAGTGAGADYPCGPELGPGLNMHRPRHELAPGLAKHPGRPAGRFAPPQILHQPHAGDAGWPRWVLAGAPPVSVSPAPGPRGRRGTPGIVPPVRTQEPKRHPTESQCPPGHPHASPTCRWTGSPSCSSTSPPVLGVFAIPGAICPDGGRLILDCTEPALRRDGVTTTTGSYAVGNVAVGQPVGKPGIPLPNLRQIQTMTSHSHVAGMNTT
jgi:hypothetical protein